MLSNSEKRPRIFILIAVLTVLVSAVSAVLQIDSILMRWQVILLLSFFVVLQLSLPESIESSAYQQKSSTIILLQTLILVYLVLSTGIGFSFMILFFVLSVNVALYNPFRWVIVWVLGFVLVTAYLNVRAGGWERLLLETAVYAAGYLFFGVTTSALRSAQMSQALNERLYQKQTFLVSQQKELLDLQGALLEELQQKNRELEQYTMQAETLAVAEERNRMSREMHDTLGHRLTSSVVQLEAAQRLLPDQSERAAIMIGEVRQEVRLALSELRQTVGRLREPVEAELDLLQALKRMVDRFESVSRIQVHLELPDESCPMTPAQHLALYRGAQEGLTNIQRHAQASEVHLRLVCTPEEICLELRDNGKGLQTDTPETLEGFGIRGLVERSNALGGITRLENAPEGGAVLTIRLPGGGG